MRGIEKTAGLMKVMGGLRDRSKRDPSTSRADFFAGAKKKKASARFGRDDCWLPDGRVLEVGWA
jgi:hypothetical protein